jgi:hypothetical protein
VSKSPVARPSLSHFPAFCRVFWGALGRTRTCGLLIRRGTLRLFIGPVASRLAHEDGGFAWPLISVDPPWPARSPSRGWYRRWYGNSVSRDVYGIVEESRRVRCAVGFYPFDPLRRAQERRADPVADDRACSDEGGSRERRRYASLVAAARRVLDGWHARSTQVAAVC